MLNTTTIDDSIRYFELLHRNIIRRGGKPPTEELIALRALREKKKRLEGFNEQTTL